MKILYSNLYFIIALVIINFFLILKYKYFSNYLKTYDNKNVFRKVIKKKIPLLGGVIIFLNILLLIIYFFLFKKNFFFNSIFQQNIDIYLFFLVISFFYFLGWVDDKININPMTKFIFLIIFSFFLITINDLFLIKTLNFYIIPIKNIDLKNFSTYFTVFCLIIFVIAMNMHDGINLNSFYYYFFFYLISLFFLQITLLNIVILLSLIFFGILNRVGKIYLGDSGSNLLSIITAINLIVFYNFNYKYIYVEHVITLCSIPFLDLFRLFLFRIYNGRNPMKADASHLHHNLIKKFSFTTSAFLINFPIFLSASIQILLPNLFFINILLICFYYFFLLNIK